MEKLISAAEQAFSVSDWQEARKHLRAALLVQPEHSTALFLAAQVEAKRGNLDEAIEILSAVDEQDARFGVSAIGQNAQWLAELGRLQEAKEQYTKALTLAPNVDFLRHQFAQFLNFVGWRYEARDVLMPLVQSGHATEAELRGLLNLSNSIATSTAKSDIAEKAPLDQSLIWMSNRMPRNAIEILTHSLEAGVIPRDSSVDAVLMAAYAELQEHEKVRELLVRESAEIQRHPLYWRAIGDQLIHQGMTEQAAGAYLRALQLDSTSQIEHERMSSVLIQLGEKEKARAVEERKNLWLAVGQIIFQVGSEQPGDLSAGQELAKYLEALGHPSEASAWLELILQRHGGSASSAAIKDEIDRLRSSPLANDRQRSLAGLTGEEYPVPKIQKAMDLLEPQERGPGAKPKSGASPERTPATFIDVAREKGLHHTYRNAAKAKLKNFQIYEALGAGVAALDFDCDGYVDIYCGQGGCDPPLATSDFSNALFRNLAGRFLAVTESASADDYNYTTCVTAGDINQDGFPDLVIGNLGLNRLLINQGDGTFQDVSQRLGWNDPETSHYTMGVAIADVSGDGMADVVEMNYVNDPSMYAPLTIGPDGDLLKIAAPIHYRAEADRLWINDGQGDLTAQVLGPADDDSNSIGAAALGNVANPGLGLIVSDLDDEPGLELFVANDGRPNQLWKRSRSGSEASVSLEFTDVAVSRGCAFSARGEACACMGVAWADFDGNGMPDLMITNWYDEWLNLYLFEPNGICRDAAPRYGLDRLSEGLLGFGCQPIDFDNDSLVDVAIVNGHIDNLPNAPAAYAMPSQLLENLGDRFELAEQVDSDYWAQDHVGRCVITCDYNRDGKTDFIAVDLLKELSLLENQTQTKNDWIQFQIVGVDSERDAIGARVTIRNGSMTQSSVTATGDGYQGKNEQLVSFGLASSDSPLEVSIRWPGGETITYQNLQKNARYLLVQNEQVPWMLVTP